eukprot:6240457-Prymnesium_polylepis.1
MPAPPPPPPGACSTDAHAAHTRGGPSVREPCHGAARRASLRPCGAGRRPRARRVLAARLLSLEWVTVPSCSVNHAAGATLQDAAFLPTPRHTPVSPCRGRRPQGTLSTVRETAAHSCLAAYPTRPTVFVI